MMKKVENDPGYTEGVWSGKAIIQHIDKTEYRDLETAIKVKEELIQQFETQFGYAREMAVIAFDRNYATNVGILDTLKEAYDKKNS